MKARIVMMIHDSIWVEAPVAEEKEARRMLEEIMTTVAELSVPLEVKLD